MATGLHVELQHPAEDQRCCNNRRSQISRTPTSFGVHRLPGASTPDQQDVGHIQQIVSTLDPTLQSTFSVIATNYGQKTLEKVRGNANIWNWLRDNKCDFEEWIKEIKNFRPDFNKMDLPAQDVNMVDNLAE